MNSSGPIQSNTILQQSPPHPQSIPQMAGPSQPQSNQLISQTAVSHPSQQQQQQQQSTQEQNYFNAAPDPQIPETQLATTMRMHLN